jgi:hypothetical protein
MREIQKIVGVPQDEKSPEHCSVKKEAAKKGFRNRKIN